MPPSRVQRTALSDRACLQCQKRKSKCVPRDADQPCEYCAKSQRECTFPQRPPRTPLTRKNLQDAESRCQELESMLEQYRRSSVERSSVAPTPVPAPAPVTADVTHTLPVNPVQNSTRPANTAVRDETADASPYEWDETLVGDEPSPDCALARDGMPSFGGGNVGTGYMGTTSGRAMLDTISSALSPGASSTLQAPQETEPAALPLDRASLRPLSRTLATSHVQDQLIAAYFEYYNNSYPVIHERTFRSQCASRNRYLRDGSWYMLYHMVLAIGEWVGGFNNEHHSMYYDAARSRLGPESLERGNLTTIQAFLLMSNYQQKRDRPNTGFNLLGIAHRMAFGLGLHREPSQQGKVDTLSELRRRTVFWVLYCFDSGFSITTGRPIFMIDSFIDVNIPRNFDDTSCQAPADHPTEVPRPTNVSAIIAQARLAKLANKAYGQFSGISPCTDADHQTSVMEHMLQTWRSSLPAYFLTDDVPLWFKRSRKVVLWKEENVRILVLLASQRQRTDLHEKIAVGQRYQAVAAATIVDICTFYEDPQMPPNPGLGWYAVYFLLQAALALSVHELAKCNISALPEGQERTDARTYDELVEKTRKCLESLAQFDQNGATALRGLAQLQKGVVRSRSDASVPASQNAASVMPTEGFAHPTDGSGGLNPMRDAGVLRHSMGVVESTDTLASGADGMFTHGLYDFMDTSFSAFDNGDYLTGVFQDCYGPFQSNQEL